MPDTPTTLHVSTATADDADGVAAVRNAAAADLTSLHGPGPWSGTISTGSVLRGIHVSRVLIAHDGHEIVGTLRLTTRKPSTIDLARFENVERPLYLVDMAVSPRMQRRGVGRLLLGVAVQTASGWRVDAIRLDAYDHAAGAGPFYAKCGFTAVARNTDRTTPLIYYELRLREAS